MMRSACTWLFGVFLLQVQLMIAVSATSSSANYCLYDHYDGPTKAVNYPCGRDDAIVVRISVNLTKENCINSTFSAINQRLVKSGSITLKSLKCDGAPSPMFDKITTIVSYDNFAIRLDEAHLPVDSFRSLESITLVNIEKYCPLTVNDIIIFQKDEVTSETEARLLALAKTALEPCIAMAMKQQAPKTIRKQVEEKFAMLLYTMTQRNFPWFWVALTSVVFLFWPSLFYAFIRFKERLMIALAYKDDHMRDREAFRAHLEITREYLPHSELCLAMGKKMMRYFDVTAVYYYLIGDILLSRLIWACHWNGPDDQVQMEAKAIYRRFKKVVIPILLEIDERNKKLASKKLIHHQMRLYTNAERRKLEEKADQPFVIEIDDESVWVRFIKRFNVLKWFRKKPAVVVNMDPGVCTDEQRAAMAMYPFAKKIAAEFMGAGASQTRNADLAGLITLATVNSVDAQKDLEYLIDATMNLLRLMGDKGREAEYEYARLQREKNRSFLVLEHYEETQEKLKKEGKSLPLVRVTPELDLQAIEEVVLSFYDESKTLAENRTLIDAALNKCIARYQKMFNLRWAREKDDALYFPMEHELYISPTASARIKKLAITHKAEHDEKHAKKLAVVKAEKAKEDAAFEQAKQKILDEKKLSGELERLLANGKFGNITHINYSRAQPPVTHGAVEKAVRQIKAERRIRKEGVRTSDLPPPPKPKPKTPPPKSTEMHTAIEMEDEPPPQRRFFGLLPPKKAKKQAPKPKPVEQPKPEPPKPPVLPDDAQPHLLFPPTYTKHPDYYIGLPKQDGVVRPRREPEPFGDRVTPKEEKATKVYKKRDVKDTK